MMWSTPTISAEKDKVHDVPLISCRQMWLLLSQRCELKSPHSKNAAIVILFHTKSRNTPVYLVDVVIAPYDDVQESNISQLASTLTISAEKDKVHNVQLISCRQM